MSDNIFSTYTRLRDEGLYTDKAEHQYLEHYDRHLGSFASRFAGRAGVLVEIGVESGASLHLWSRWLHDWSIVGVDINEQCATLDLPDRTHIVVGDARQLATLDYACQWGNPTVVIDDGSHQARDQITAFNRLWPRLKPGGWYVIEDLGVMWRTPWGGAPSNPNPAAQFLSTKFLEAVNCDPADTRWLAIPEPERRREIVEFHAYEQIVFMRKAG